MNERSSMLAAVFTRTGPAEQVLHVEGRPVPEPGAGEVLVRVQAASMQPADHLFVGGVYRRRPVLPQVAGLVGAGIIVTGDATVDLRPGTRVAFRHPGAWAEYCTVPADCLYRIPGGIGWAQASQFALNPVTAWGLLDVAGARKGDWVAVNAPGSNVAGMVRALAQSRGIRVAEIHREPPSERSTAAADGSSVASRLLAATGGEPVSALLDCVGGEAIIELLPVLRQGAVIVSYGVLGNAAAPLRNADLIYRNLTWTGFGVDHWLASQGPRREAMARSLWEEIASGALPVPVRSTFRLDSLEDALRSDAKGGTGKVILTMGAGA